MSIENLEKPRLVKAAAKPRSRVQNKDSSSYFHTGMGLLLISIMLLGFWMSYFGAVSPAIEMESPMGGVPVVIHIHATVFVGWFLLYIYQSFLIFRKKVRSHRKTGKFGMYLGAAVFITGLLVLFFQQYELVLNKDKNLIQGTIGTAGVWMQLVSFAVLLFLGYKSRWKPEFHKRYLLFATIALMPAAFIRTVGLDFIWNSLGQFGPAYFAVFILAVIFIHDLLTLRKIHKVTLLGSGLLVVDMVLLAMGFA